VIEGFYGRQWSWQARQSYAPFLARYDFSTYIFAPKGEALLRSRWAEPFGGELRANLLALAAQYHRHGLRFGVGLSPFGLHDDLSTRSRQRLKDKVKAINEMAVDTLCILFDDMSALHDDLAQRQLAIVDDVLSVSRASRHIICPSYYSFDPVLEQVFGPMPVGYWQTLGAGLPGHVDYFWTGDQVISESIGAAGLQSIGQLMQRRPVLWDNYPVNDGRSTSPFIHLQGYTGRSFELEVLTEGHCVNPMNQAELSKPVLVTLCELYRNRHAYRVEQALRKALHSLCGRALAAQLLVDLPRFQSLGLNGLSEDDREQMRQVYSQFREPMAAEVLGWLRGDYVFDPACLTG
jgi:hypothetical protein